MTMTRGESAGDNVKSEEPGLSTSKLARSPKLGVIFQFTEVTPPHPSARAWEIHDVERGRAFHVTLADGELSHTPPGFRPLGREWNPAEIVQGVLVALERALLAPPEKVPGPVYEVAITGQDLHDARRGDE